MGGGRHGNDHNGPMQFAEHLAGIIAEAGALLDVVGEAPDRAVPACPGWTVAELARHTGSFHRWATAHLRNGQAGEIVAVSVAAPEVADDDLVPWFADGASEVVAELAAAGPDLACWTFGAPRTAAFWARRMCHETAVHRHDAQEAVGAAVPFDPVLAADGVDELLTVMLRLALRARTPAPGPSLHLHRTDEGEGAGEWMVTVADDGAVAVTHEHGKGDAAVRGTASDLLLYLWGRRAAGTGSLEAFGDPAVVAAWGSLAP